MQSLSISVPLKAGMADVIRQHRAEIVHGLDGLDHESHGAERGFTTVKMFHQTTPTEALVFYFEAHDIEEAFHPKHLTHEVSQKWDAFFTQVAGLSGEFMTEMPEMLVDWHHKEGHRVKPAKT